MEPGWHAPRRRRLLGEFFEFVRNRQASAQVLHSPDDHETHGGTTMLSWHDRDDLEDAQLLRDLELLAALLLTCEDLEGGDSNGLSEPRSTPEARLQWPPEARNRRFPK